MRMQPLKLRPAGACGVSRPHRTCHIEHRPGRLVSDCPAQAHGHRGQGVALGLAGVGRVRYGTHGFDIDHLSLGLIVERVRKLPHVTRKLLHIIPRLRRRFQRVGQRQLLGRGRQPGLRRFQQYLRLADIRLGRGFLGAHELDGGVDHPEAAGVGKNLRGVCGARPDQEGRLALKLKGVGGEGKELGDGLGHAAPERLEGLSVHAVEILALAPLPLDDVAVHLQPHQRVGAPGLFERDEAAPVGFVLAEPAHRPQPGRLARVAVALDVGGLALGDLKRCRLLVDLKIAQHEFHKKNALLYTAIKNRTSVSPFPKIPRI